MNTVTRYRETPENHREVFDQEKIVRVEGRVGGRRVTTYAPSYMVTDEAAGKALLTAIAVRQPPSPWISVSALLFILIGVFVFICLAFAADTHEQTGLYRPDGSDIQCLDEHFTDDRVWPPLSRKADLTITYCEWNRDGYDHR